MPASLREFIDEPSLLGDEVLYRAVDPGYIDNWSSAPANLPGIPSRAWQDQKEEVAAGWGLRPCASVAVASLLTTHGSNVETWLEAFFRPSYGVIETTVGEMRSAKSMQGILVPQGVMLHPTDEQPWHAVVWSLKGSKRSKGEMKALVFASRWHRHPRR